MLSRNVFVTGSTGYIARKLIPQLITRGHTVRALARPGSEHRVPPGAQTMIGDALDADTFSDQLGPSDTFVQLLGVPHPSPSKGAQFRAVDLKSIQASVTAASKAGIGHFIYVSVAHPAPMMKDYIAVRSEGERLIIESGMRATILRPWYVLGPGHRWPYILIPYYWLFERIPGTRDVARRLGLVTLKQMVSALVSAVESPPTGVRVIEVPDIRAANQTGAA